MLLGVVITDNSPQLGGGGVITDNNPQLGGNITYNNPQLHRFFRNRPPLFILSTRFIMLIGYFKEILKLTF